MFKIFIVLFLACNVLVLTPNYKIVSEKRLLSSDKDYQLTCNSCGSYCLHVYFQFWQIIYIHNVCPTTMNEARRCCLTLTRGRRDRDRIVVGFTTTYAIDAYHHWCCRFDSQSGWGVQHYVIKFVGDLRHVCDFLWVLVFPPPIKLTITMYLEILLKVTLNTTKPTKIILTIGNIVFNTYIYYNDRLFIPYILCHIIRMHCLWMELYIIV